MAFTPDHTAHSCLPPNPPKIPHPVFVTKTTTCQIEIALGCETNPLSLPTTLLIPVAPFNQPSSLTLPNTTPTKQGPNEIALGCETDPLSAYADVDGTFMRDAPFAPLGPAGFNYMALPPSSALWMIQDLTWSVSSSANVSTDAVARLVAAANNKTHVW